MPSQDVPTGYTFSIPTLPGLTYHTANGIRKSLRKSLTWWQFTIFAFKVVDTCWQGGQQDALRTLADEIRQEYPHRSHSK